MDGKMDPRRKIYIDRIVRECVDRAYPSARLGRREDDRARNAVLAKLLSSLEESGDAMRYVDAKGRIAWRATPRLRDIIKDLEKDVRLEFEDEDV
jgi:hypothetical protein